MANIKILVVDDEQVMRDLFTRVLKLKGYTATTVEGGQVMRDLFTRVLKLKGYTVTTVEGGKEAIERVKEEEFDIAFIDIVMPEMDGVETFRGIKKVNPKVHMVMMTGFAVQDKLDEAEKLGAYKSLHKPFDIVEIMAVIGMVEKGKRE